MTKHIPLLMKNTARSFPGLRTLCAASVLLAGALFLAWGIAAVIKTIQQDADHWRQGQIVLLRLEKDIYLLNTLELENYTDPSLAESNHLLVSSLDARAQQHFAELHSLHDPEPRATAQVDKTLYSYMASVNQEAQFFGSHQEEKGNIFHEETVKPAYSDLTDAVLKANRDYGVLALSANRNADIGTLAVLMAAALLLSALAGRALFIQRTNTRLATQQESLRQSEVRFRALIRNASDVIAILDKEGTLGYLSAATRHLWGYTPEELTGTSVFSLTPADEAERARELVMQTCAELGGTLTTEMNLRHADGSWHVCEVILTNQLQEPGVEGIVMTCRDITERKAFNEKLTHQAFHDPLTQLPNRALFMERLDHALIRARRRETPVGVVFLDLDNFKVVNDSLGHEAGDFLLRAVGERLTACVRPGDTVARLGGDEFTILLEDMTDTNQVTGLVERIGNVLAKPLVLQGREVFTTGSLGVAISHGDTRTSGELVRDADTAMYEAKTNGKACFVLFDRSMNTQALERLELEMDLRRALDNNEFRVYYQPIVTLPSGRISEAEALVRWHHPTRGLIAPARFIPLAEETGMILPLGLWVLREACRQTRLWQDHSPELEALTISVNVSTRQLQQSELVAQVAQILTETGLSASCLKLEITESAMMHDSKLTILRLHELKALGIRLAVDDFGTGYSSMAYLSSLPIDTLKIDRSFVIKMCEHEEDAAIVYAIVTLAKTLKLRITSEGIETSEQFRRLCALGCDLGQGYYFSQPLPPEQFCSLLAGPTLAAPEMKAVSFPGKEFATLTGVGYNAACVSNSPA